MRKTTVTNTENSTTVIVEVDDMAVTLVMPHRLVPEQLCMQFAQALTQIPSSYAPRPQDKK